MPDIMTEKIKTQYTPVGWKHGVLDVTLFYKMRQICF